MSNLEQDNPKVAGVSAQGQARSKFIRWLDSFLDGVYRNRWYTLPPQGIAEKIWGMPQNSENSPDGEAYFLHYFQSQGYGPTPNECVTTSALMSMNMLKDQAALSKGQPFEPDRSIQEYIHHLETLGLRGWVYRFSTKSPLPGMMTPWQAVWALKGFAKSLKMSCLVQLSAHRKLVDLIKELQTGNIILIHGAWQMTLDPNNKNFGYNPLLAILGGMPHTMLLAGYDGKSERWLLLNPADPWPADKQKPVAPKIFKMTTKQLLDFWGRKFLFYPPRFAITSIKLETERM